MEFFINRHATLPVLTMEVIDDGRNDFGQLFRGLENACVTFSMIDTADGSYKVANKPAGIVPQETIHEGGDPRYMLFYKFTANDTDAVGRYQAQFRIRLLDGVIDSGTADLIVPVQEFLYVNVNDSFVKLKTC